MKSRYAVSRGVTVLVGVLLVLPMPMIVIVSLSVSPLWDFPPEQITFSWYVDAVTNTRWIRAATTSLGVAVGAAVVATIAGVSLALGAWLLGGTVRRSLSLVVLAQLVLPSAVYAAALYLIYANVGLLGTGAGLALAHGLMAVPVVFVAVLGSLDAVSGNLLEAAATLGASRTLAWRTVVLPLVAPTIVVVAIFAFVHSLDEPVVATLIGRGTAVTLPNLIWQQIGGSSSPTVAAVAVVTAVIGIGVQITAVLVYVRATRRKIRAAVVPGLPIGEAS